MMRELSLSKMPRVVSGRVSDDGTTKRCKCCEQNKPIGEFMVGRINKRQDPYCETCRPKKRAESSDKRKARRATFAY
jgi:hypothetical protein